MNILLNELSAEILLQVFQYCDILDLCRLRQTCHYFNRIIESSLQFILRNGPVVTNQFQAFIKQRSAALLSVHDKWRIAHYWKIGKYNEKSLLYERENFIPWLNLSKEHVWISRGHYVKALRRTKNRIDSQHSVYILSGNTPADVTRFTKTNDCIFSAQSDGNVWVWSQTENRIKLNKLCHTSAINSIDTFNNLLVTGSTDGSVKIWSSNDNFATCDRIYRHFVSDKIWSSSFNSDGLNLAVGTSGCNSVAPLHIFDLTNPVRKCILGETFPRGSGILDMKWVNSNILLTCGYDTFVRKWDLRTETCAQAWKDPFYATVYCLDTDGFCTLLTGTQSNGRVVLFDIRQTEYMQMYYMQSCKRRGRSSPVYSLSYEPAQLFAATDQHLNVLDFTDKEAKVRNYSNLYCREINVSL